mmetsp:Transcript_13396/g.49761  ORF Transcript_13396/g.49761 Transcript_13396/m.49761 type:complete len:348 (+) Transcript_13396:255-1298(+)
MLATFFNTNRTLSRNTYYGQTRSEPKVGLKKYSPMTQTMSVDRRHGMSSSPMRRGQQSGDSLQPQPLHSEHPGAQQMVSVLSRIPAWHSSLLVGGLEVAGELDGDSESAVCIVGVRLGMAESGIPGVGALESNDTGGKDGSETGDGPTEGAPVVDLVGAGTVGAEAVGWRVSTTSGEDEGSADTAGVGSGDGAAEGLPLKAGVGAEVSRGTGAGLGAAEISTVGAALVVGALDGGEDARSVGDADGAAVMIVHSSVHAPSMPFWSPLSHSSSMSSTTPLPQVEAPTVVASAEAPKGSKALVEAPAWTLQMYVRPGARPAMMNSVDGRDGATITKAVSGSPGLLMRTR